MVTIRRHIGKFCFLRYKLYWFKGIQYWCNQCFLFLYRCIRQFCYLQFYSLCYRYYPTPCKVYAQSYCLYSIDSCSKMVSIANLIITDPCGLASVSWRMTGATIRWYQIILIIRHQLSGRTALPCKYNNGCICH